MNERLPIVLYKVPASESLGILERLTCAGKLPALIESYWTRQRVSNLCSHFNSTLLQHSTTRSLLVLGELRREYVKDSLFSGLFLLYTRLYQYSHRPEIYMHLPNHMATNIQI